MRLTNRRDCEIQNKRQNGDKPSNPTERREKAPLFYVKMPIWYTSVQVQKNAVVSQSNALERKSDSVQYGEKMANKTGKGT